MDKPDFNINHYKRHKNNATSRFRKCRIISLLVILTSVLPTWAQFRVVDANTNEPVQGAFVINRDGNVIELTNADGMVSRCDGIVSIRMLSYETATVDASTQKEDVRLVAKPMDLGEVIVTPLEYIKTSGVFRDVCRNDGKLIVYREGIVDFYYNIKSGKYTRRVRACRQYADRRLDRLFDYSIYPGPYYSFDMRKLKRAEASDVTEQRGDTTIVGIKNGARDGIIDICNSGKGIYRSIIDGIKSHAVASTLTRKYKSCYFDWTYRDANHSLAGLVSFTGFVQMDYLIAVKGFKAVGVTRYNEFVVTDIQTLSREDAKREMKNKEQLSEFTLPDVLPSLNFDLETEVQGFKITKFDEY